MVSLDFNRPANPLVRRVYLDVIGLVPTKGLPLPLLSYGGTSMVMAMAALGALLALSRRPAVR